MNESVAHVIAVLQAHQPIDVREEESIRTFLSVVTTLEQPCSEDTNPIHVTASAIVVSDDGEKVALHLHKRLNMWLQPGGHIDPGETPPEGALREALEETGLPVRHEQDGGVFFHVDVHPGPKGHTHLDLRYLVRSPHVAPTPADGESQEVAWFSWDDAFAIADAGLVGALQAAQALLGLK